MSEEKESLKDKVKRCYAIRAYIAQAKEEELELRNEIVAEAFSEVDEGKTGKLMIGQLQITCKKGTSISLNLDEYEKSTPEVKQWLESNKILKIETKVAHKLSKPAINKVSEEMQPWLAPYILEKPMQPTLDFKGIEKKDQ